MAVVPLPQPILVTSYWLSSSAGPGVQEHDLGLGFTTVTPWT